MAKYDGGYYIYSHDKNDVWTTEFCLDMEWLYNKKV